MTQSLAWSNEPAVPQMELHSTFEQTPQEDYRKLFMKTTGMVIGVIALLLLTVWFIKRFSMQRMTQVNQMNHIKIIEKRSLSPKSMLYLLNIGGKQVLIAESQVDVKEVATIDQQQRMGQPQQLASFMSELED